jgi:hypothetical protein
VVDDGLLRRAGAALHQGVIDIDVDEERVTHDKVSKGAAREDVRRTSVNMVAVDCGI